MKSALCKEELIRYQRHLILPQISLIGQEKLKSSSVLIVGAGGLGSPAALYLTAAGVGKIGLADFDAVEVSNLQRQILFVSSDIGKLKVNAAYDRLSDLNPHVRLIPHAERFDIHNAISLISEYDLIIDASDNFSTRYLLNDAAVLTNKPLIHGSIFQFEGYLTVFNYKNGPCYRCLYPVPPEPGTVPSCSTAGVVGFLPGIIGTLQAAEAIKIILDLGEIINNRMVTYDSLQLSLSNVKIKKNINCEICGNSPVITELHEIDEFCDQNSNSSIQSPIEHKRDDEIDVIEYKKLRDSGIPHILLDVREEYETEISRIDGSIWVPLDRLDEKINELDPKLLYIIYCSYGLRSYTGLEIMRHNGFKNVKNLIGGINEWANKIDTTLATY